MIYLKLFWSFFQIGLFSIGGGLASLPLIQSQVVEINKWITLKEFTDLITIAQMTPGPIAINSSTFVGMQIGGLGGAIVSTLGCVLPSFIILSILSYLYNKYKELKAVQGIFTGLRPAVVSLIASAGFTIVALALFGEGGFNIKSIDLIAVGLIATALFVLRKFKPNQVFVMLGSGLIGGIIYYFFP